MSGSAATTADPTARSTARYAQVVVDVEPAHLDHPFDYAIPEDLQVEFGQQVAVPFSGRRRTGWVVGTSDTTTAEPARIKDIAAVRGALPRFDHDDLRLYRWVAGRWGGTLSSVLRHALPRRVAAVDEGIAGWGNPAEPAPALRPPCRTVAWRAYAASDMLRAAAAVEPVNAAAAVGSGNAAMAVEPVHATVQNGLRRSVAPAFWWRPLPGEDTATLVADLVVRCLSAGRSALVLAADPASHVPDACLDVAGREGADLRGTRSDRLRYRAFLRGRTGHARVMVGERGAVFAPLRRLGLVVVDDEANPAYKERRSPRHHARDVALARARFADATAVLTGALPSAAVWRLMERGDIRPIEANRPEIRARAPRVDVVDPGQSATIRSRLSAPADHAVRAVTAAGGVAVVLVARRGEGTALACRRCGARAACPVCDSAIGPSGVLRRRCAACGWEGLASPCRSCGAEAFIPLAAGTGRWATELARAHPTAEVAVMEGFDASGPNRRPAIAVMTRGSVVAQPAWLADDHAGILVLPDADALLGRPRFDAAEDLLRLCLAITWADRVIVQTRHPGDPAIQALVRWDPEGFWRGEAPRRGQLGYPPARVLMHLDAPRDRAKKLAEQVLAALPEGDELAGPDLDGRLQVKSADPHGTLSALTLLRQRWSVDGIRVTVDVDPVPALDRRT